MNVRFRLSSCLACLSLLVIMALTACQSMDSIERDSLTLTPERLARQSMQVRRFGSNNPDVLFKAIISVLQDQHFTIREMNRTVGFVYADKTEQKSQPFVLWGPPLNRMEMETPTPLLGFGLGFGPSWFLGDDFDDLPYVTRELISISMVMFPAQQQSGYEVRITIQCRNFLNTGNLQRGWMIDNPKTYQQLFEALSHASYLEAYPL